MTESKSNTAKGVFETMDDKILTPEFFKGIQKGMSATHKLILVGLICATTILLGYRLTDGDQEAKKNLHIEYGYTHNLGDYESMRLRVGFDRRLNMGEDPERVMNYELDKLRSFIHNKVLQYERENRVDRVLKKGDGE